MVFVFPGRLRHVLHVAALWLCLGTPASLSAHNVAIERSLMIDVAPTQVEILAIYSEPPGIRTERLLALYDLDRDGRLDGKELLHAMPEVAKRAFLGIQILVDGQPANFTPTMRCKREQNRGQSCALYGVFPTTHTAKKIEVNLADQKGILSTPTRITSSHGLIRTLLNWNHKPHTGDDVITLVAGNTLSASFEPSGAQLANPDPLK